MGARVGVMFPLEQQEAERTQPGREKDPGQLVPVEEREPEQPGLDARVGGHEQWNDDRDEENAHDDELGRCWSPSRITRIDVWRWGSVWSGHPRPPGSAVLANPTPPAHDVASTLRRTTQGLAVPSMSEIVAEHTGTRLRGAPAA